MDTAAVIALVTALTAFVSALSAWYGSRYTSRRAEAEGTKFITETTLSLIEPLKDRIAALEAEVKELKEQVGLWQDVAERRGWQVVELGKVPISVEEVSALRAVYAAQRNQEQR